MQHEHTEHVAASADAVYAAISNLDNLPRFVPQLTAVHPAEGDRIEVEARYHGHEQHGEATFHADAGERRIEWSAPSGYRGWMKVDADGEGMTSGRTARIGRPRDHLLVDDPRQRPEPGARPLGEARQSWRRGALAAHSQRGPK